jgi:hypothetical protein
VEKHGKSVQRVYIIFAFFADIAFPGGEIGECDHAFAREGEVGHRNRVHLADTTAAAWDGLGGGLGMSHNMFMFSRVRIINQIG